MIIRSAVLTFLISAWAAIVPREVATQALLRTAQQRPDSERDLQGVWTNATATPLRRPSEFADKPFFTPAEAAEFERTSLDRFIKSLAPEDQLASDLNDTFLDVLRFRVIGLRTSLIVDPKSGVLPPLVPAANARAAAQPKRSFEGPETFNLHERCLAAVNRRWSAAVPPMVPALDVQYLYQIVQTPSFVMIFSELIHDARVIRMNGAHLPANVQRWLGDSIGHWDGSTLVVDTTNFIPKTGFAGSGERLHVVERFTRVDASTIRYVVTVDDPDTWATPWTAEIPFKATTDPMLEYACHEANYTVENFLRGARDEERRGVRSRP